METINIDNIGNDLKAAYDEGYAQGTEDAWRMKTIYGYSVKELSLFAALCKQQGITPEKMHEYYERCETVATLVFEDLRLAANKAVEEYFANTPSDLAIDLPPENFINRVKVVD